MCVPGLCLAPLRRVLRAPSSARCFPLLPSVMITVLRVRALLAVPFIVEDGTEEPLSKIELIKRGYVRFPNAPPLSNRSGGVCDHATCTSCVLGAASTSARGSSPSLRPSRVSQRIRSMLATTSVPMGPPRIWKVRSGCKPVPPSNHRPSGGVRARAAPGRRRPDVACLTFHVAFTLRCSATRGFGPRRPHAATKTVVGLYRNSHVIWTEPYKTRPNARRPDETHHASALDR